MNEEKNSNDNSFTNNGQQPVNGPLESQPNRLISSQNLNSQPIENLPPTNQQPQPPVQNQNINFQPVQQASPVINTYQQSTSSQSPKKKINIKLLLLILSVVAIVIASIIFIPKLFENKEGKKASESLTSSKSFWIRNEEGLNALFDINGKQLTKFNYKNVRDNFINGTMYVENADNQYGIISANGKMIADFGKYSHISQITGVYEVYDKKYNKYLIDGSGNVLYDLKNYSLDLYDNVSFFILEKDKTYYVLNYEGKEITSFPINNHADSPEISEADDYGLIFYNNKQYIINPYSKKAISTFDSDKAYCLKGVSENNTILINSCPNWSASQSKITYKIIKDNKVNNLPEECTDINFDENDDNIIVCQSDDGKFLLTDNYQKGIKINTNNYVNKVYSNNKGYAYERINANNYVLRVDFVQNENTVKSVSCRELKDRGYMSNGLYILEKQYTAGCETELGETYEYYNTSGEKMFGRGFKYATPFEKNNLAIVIEDKTEEYSLIDTHGKQVGKSYEKIELLDDNNYYMVQKDKMFGIVNDKGKEIVPCKYSSIEIEKNNCVKLKKDDSKIIIYNLLKNKKILSVNNSESNVTFFDNYIRIIVDGKTKYYSYANGKMFYQE